jgi:arylsulfatase A-like enzyme
MLEKHQGQVMTGKGDVVVSQGNPGGIMPSPWKFRKYGQSGLEVSELFPHVGSCADDLAVIRSMYSISNDHAPALYQMNTGFVLPGYPSMGSWITYGLGSESENLPGFIVFSDHRGGPIGGAPNWGNGYMPAAYQGTQFRSTGDPIVDLNPPKDMPRDRQRRWLDYLAKMNAEHLAKNPQDTELTARIATYELAFRMQVHATEAIDLAKESEETRKLYGLDEEPTQYFGRQALMAARLVERGVRFVQIFSGGGNFQESWDAHWDIVENHGTHARETDKPLAALIKDLKRRGLFDNTLIIWHGEFGRMPISQRMDGRDHNPLGFTLWLAGGGVKGGTIYGSTDEYGYKAEENRTSVNDLHATILHLLGFDHEKLTYPHLGRNMRLTDVSGTVVKGILA